jgi:hypothetical protein
MKTAYPPAYFWLFDCGALLVVLAAVKEFAQMREAVPQQSQSIVAQPERPAGSGQFGVNVSLQFAFANSAESLAH